MEDDEKQRSTTVAEVGNLVAVIGLIAAVIAWIIPVLAPRSAGPSLASTFWLFLTFAVAIGVWLGGTAKRRWLEYYEKRFREMSFEEAQESDILEECRRRTERRKSIRAGEVDDDGLSEFGRWMKQTEASNPERAKRVEELLEDTSPYSPQLSEDIFASEEDDLRIEAAWKRKVAAESAWKKVIGK